MLTNALPWSHNNHLDQIEDHELVWIDWEGQLIYGGCVPDGEVLEDFQEVDLEELSELGMLQVLVEGPKPSPQ